jgi:hypothetical protein
MTNGVKAVPFWHDRAIDIFKEEEIFYGKKYI